jgi:hypothetical protein
MLDVVIMISFGSRSVHVFSRLGQLFESINTCLFIESNSLREAFQIVTNLILA